MSWQKQPLDQVADFLLGKMLDQKKNKGDLLPYLANVNVRWGAFELENLREMRFEPHEKERYGLREGDIVMCEGGEPGRCAIWNEQLPDMMFQKALHRIRPHDCLDNRFLYYSFLQKGRTNGFQGLFTGSTIKHLPKEKLAKVEVEVPPLTIQQKIADVLSAYDDLIENNRRRIALLEEAARLLYREWFVHFRYPGCEHSNIINGVPDGWEQSTIGEHCPLVYGKALKADTRIPGDCDVYGSSGIVGTHNKELVTGPAIVIGRKGNVGSIFWARRDFWPIDTVYYISSENSDFYTYYALQHVTFINTDVAVPGLNRDFAHSRKLLIPTDVLLDEFHAQVEPIQAQIGLLQRQSDELAKARDLLLPRLMDGRLEI